MGFDFVASTIAAFVWSNGTETLLPALPGEHVAIAFDINDAGVIVGFSQSSNGGGPDHATLWSGGTVTDLNSNTNAVAINNAGDVVESNGFKWSGGVATELNGLSIAKSINDVGQIVGKSDGAAIWDNGTITDLNTVLSATGIGWNFSYASGINDVGQIVGLAINPAGDEEGFLLTPCPTCQIVETLPPPRSIPEPSTWAMMLLGFAGLGAVGYRRARSGHTLLAT